MVFGTSLGAEPALLNAIMLSFAFTVTGGTIDHECLAYQSQAYHYVRQKMASVDEAISGTTIGTILLLAGVEVSINVLLCHICITH